MLDLNARKPFLEVCDHASLKSTCSATETCYILEVLHVAGVGITLFCKPITKALIRLGIYKKALSRLGICPGWSVPLLFASKKVRFSCIKTHLFMGKIFELRRQFIWLSANMQKAKCLVL